MDANASAQRLKPITSVVELLTAGYTGTMPTMRMVDSAASSAKFPVVRINGRRFVDEATVPQIAALYELTPKATTVPAARASRKVSSARAPIAA